MNAPAAVAARKIRKATPHGRSTAESKPSGSLFTTGQRPESDRNRPAQRHRRCSASDGSFTVMETPLHMACAIQEAFLQSHHEHLSIFPCVPEAWPNAAFHRFLAQGGHIVSAAMEDGEPAWVEIESPHGGSLVVTIPFASPPQLIAGAGADMKTRDDGKIEITLAPGARCQIRAVPTVNFKIQPAPALSNDANPFGLK
jgi:alpha-L-fucosidase 2